jgi:nucleoside-diphosphate-sugar epimerase
MHLITGIKSGLGKFLHEQLGGLGYSRQDNLESIKKKHASFDAIIHCAFNVNRGIDSLNFQEYVDDNLLLIQKLLAIPHQKFIFISSADVYPKEDKAWQENDEFLIEKVEGLYGTTKLIAEMMVKNQATNYLILRPTALLGRYSRPNSLIKILTEAHPQLTLSPQSSFNYILHEDVRDFIQIALSQDLQGVFNLAAKDNLFLSDVAKLVIHPIQFGSYVYQGVKLQNHKALQYSKVFANSSLDNIKRYQKTMEVVC